MEKTILITGGAGFIGSCFARHLFEKYPGYRLLVLDALTYAGHTDNFTEEMRNAERFEFWYGNVNNAMLVDQLVARADAVVHFAAESHVARSIFDNRVFFETDVLGTQTVANAVTNYYDKVERFIHISTSEVYGSALSPTEPMDEDHPLLCTTPYAAAKAGADRLVYSYVVTYDVPAVIIRPFNNYGPYQHLEKVIPRFITSALLDEPLTIHGSGGAERDWLYVDDHAEALDAVLHAPLEKIRGEIINIGTGRAIDVATIAKLALEIMGKPESLITHIEDRPGQVDRHYAAISKIKDLVGWEPATVFEDGMRKTVEWYAANREWWEKMRWMRCVPVKTRSGKVVMH